MQEEEKAFRAYFDTFGIEYFSAREVLYLGSSHWIPTSPAYKLNEIPPRHLWQNIIPTVKLADMARRRVGPIRILSGYRSDGYNSAVGGAPRSLHKQFRALDLMPVKARPADLFDALEELRDDGAFLGGLGIYSSFIHVDTRGQNVTWDNT